MFRFGMPFLFTHTCVLGSLVKEMCQEQLLQAEWGKEAKALGEDPALFLDVK